MTRAAVEMPDVGLDWLMGRCDPVGDGCLDWALRAIGGRYPVVRVQGQAWYVRRLVWALTRERGVRPGMDVVAQCRRPLCVCPDCLAERKPAQRTKGIPKSLHHRMQTAQAMRARSALTEAVVREIRASDAPGAELDARFGLFAGHADRLRSGRLWRDYSNPYLGLIRQGVFGGR